MRELTATLSKATLHLIEGGDHSLEVRKKGYTLDPVLNLAAAFLGSD